MGGIRSLVNARNLQLECARFLPETLLVLVLMYGSETILWKEETSRIRTVQMDNLRGLLGIRRVDRTLKTRTREFCGVTKGIDERIDEVVLGWGGWRLIGLLRHSM